MSRFLNKKLSRLEVYTPGEQPQDKKYIKLNTNESPYPPSDGVIQALNKEEIEKLRLYCDPTCDVLRQTMAAHYHVDAENVFLSNGSDDILNFAFLAFGAKGVAFCDITYGFYSVFADLHGLEKEIIPLKEDFTVDAERFQGRGKLLVFANPNAPTGIAMSLAQVEALVQANPDSVVLIDEAYVDFGAESCAALTGKYDNLLCVGTFSKSRSMAGARLGFAIADRALIADLERIKYATNPYNINRLTQLAGAVAVRDHQYYEENCRRIIETRAFVTRELEKLDFTVLPSKANFVFAKSDRIGGLKLYEGLKERGILIRHFEKDRIRDFNRITIGSREEMETFIQKVREMLGDDV